MLWAYSLSYNADGNLLWATSTQNGDFVRGNGITTDKNNNIFITGRFGGNIKFDSSTLNSTVSIGSNDAFIWILDESGNYLNANTFGGVNSTCQGESIIINANRDILLSGVFNGTVDFDPSSADYFLTANLGNNLYGNTFILNINAGPVGIAKLKNNSSFSLYPNPSSGVVHLKSSTNLKNAELAIYNQLGQLLYQHSKLNGKQFVFNLTGLISGTYLAVINENGRKSQRLFVNKE